MCFLSVPPNYLLYRRTLDNNNHKKIVSTYSNIDFINLTNKKKWYNVVYKVVKFKSTIVDLVRYIRYRKELDCKF